MTYDSEGRLDTWTAPSGTASSDQFLYDSSGSRVLQRSTSNGTVTDTITFDGYTEVTISGGKTSTIKYYGSVALKKDGTLFYLLSDFLGSSSLALKSDGTIQSVQLFAPFGSTRYSDGGMPTTYNFTGQRLDSQTGLLYYGFRYYDPISGRFTRADTAETNAGGMDPYAYVHGNPQTFNDPSGHKEVGPCDGDCNPPQTYTQDDVDNWCAHDPECLRELEEQNNLEESQVTNIVEQTVLDLAVGIETDNPELAEQDAEKMAEERIVQKQVALQQLSEDDNSSGFDAQIAEKLNNPVKEGDILEGELGQLVNKHTKLTSFNKGFGHKNEDGEIDAESPEAIFEAKSGELQGGIKNLRKKIDNTITNPTRKPFVIYAPEWNDNQLKTAWKELSGRGVDLYIARNPDELIATIKFLQKFGPTASN
ncbi:hypothetical protein KSC_032240 [Ktedonobacter sp. SOSP1-52]|uniref:RHS repeat-associated core domain-containing protein n=1 Tax=Ktedonobacter sp. SOSP1-52 TaxID=2778366 RepID=UPI0019159188|nr:RHS repeat-associated core domain-containing protein [Ktedonobacter sp. SOSP1-52]GHO64332.1 hypothetical protein KSC_032240 [Ktedonobacter sp. SOSP1-52]